LFRAIASLTGLAATSFAVQAIAYIAVTAATSIVLSALAPKPDMSSMEGMQANQRSNVASREYVYGQVRKGGTITYMESTGIKNKYLHMVLVLAGNELSEIGDIYINDEVVTLDADGFATGDTWKSKVRIKKHLGDQTTADAALLEESEQIDSAFVGNGCAYLYIRLEYDSDVFANGIPLFTAVVKGAKVYDPRQPSNTAAYSNNPALCIRHYLTASAYGLGDTSSEIDDVAFAAAANVCDEDIALAAGGTQNQYEINGVVSASMTFGDALSKMLSACAGTLFWGGGKWQLKPGYYSTPTASFTLDDLRGTISGSPRANMRDSFNSVRGKFNDADQDWITVDYPEITSTVFVDEDNGFEQPLDLELPFTTSSPMAQRLAKITLYRARDAITFSADFGLSALSTQIGDTVALTIDRYGWSEKTFEVTGWKFYANQDAGDLRVNLVLREISASSFDWDADETEIVSNNTSLPVFNVVPAVSNLSLTATSVLNDDGISVPAITAAWDVSDDSFVEYYEIQYKRSGGEEDYGSIATAQDDAADWGAIDAAYTEEEDYGLTNEPILSPDANFFSTISTINAFTVAPVLNGYDYSIRVRAINAVGVKSPWVTSLIASEGDTTPPNEALNLTCVGGYKFINIGWTNPADQDLSHVEIWESATSNLAATSLIGTSASTNFMRPNLGNNVTKFYWVRAVDFSLNKSDFTGPQSATTILVDVDDFTDAVNDLFSEAGAFGIEPVSSLPATGGFDGQLVLLLSEITIYRWDAATSSWSTDIYTASSVEAGTITYASFAAGIEPVGVVDALPTVAGYDGPVIVVLTTDGKLYRLVDGAWTAAVNTDDIEGTIGENLFSDDLRPVERVGSLPSTGLTQGRIVLLTTDNKMYRYTGSAWTSAVPATDLTGQINGTQIADAAITATKIGNEAVTAAKIATAAITSTKLGAGSVTATAIAAAAVTAEKIGSAAVTTAKLANAAVNEDILAAGAVTGTKIANDSISTAKIVAGAVTASEIAAGSITTEKIVAGAVTASEIAAGSINSEKIAAGSITTAKIAAGAVTATTIAADAITTDKIAAGAVTASEITAGAITTAKIAAGAITATEIATGAITAGKVAASAIEADAIAANAVTSAKITAGAITADELAANAVTATKISAGAVSADAIAANAITSVKIAADAITAGKIAANAVEADAITANAITTGKIAAGAVSADQIAANAVVAEKIFASAVTADKIATDAVTANKIAAASIIASKIAAGAVTAAKMRIGDFVNYAENADFELGDDAWDTGQGGFTIEADSNFYAGSYSLRRTTTLGTTDFCVNDFQFSAAPGDQFNVSAYVKVSATYGGGGVGVGIRWFQSDGTFISTQQSNITATTAWQKVEANLTAPALAAYGVGQCRNVSQTAGTAYWDNFTLLKKQSGAALIVNGTIQADQVEANFIDAFDINADNITAGSLSADRISIDGVALDTNASGQLTIAGEGVQTGNIADRAVTTQTSVKSGGGTTTLVFSSIGGQQVVVGASCVATATSDSDNIGRTTTYVLTFNGVTVGSGSVYAANNETNSAGGTLISSETTVVGTNTLQISASGSGASSGASYISNVSMFTLEALK
jgi:hypothetical protein